MRRLLFATLAACLVLAAPAAAKIGDYDDVDPYSMERDELAEMFIDMREDLNALLQTYVEHLQECMLGNKSEETESEQQAGTVTKVTVEEATAGMLVGYDDFTEDTTYYSTYLYAEKNDTIYEREKRTYFMVWIKQDGKTGKVTPIFKFQYYGDDWILFDKVYLKTGGEMYDFDLSHILSNTDVLDDASVFETYSVKPGNNMITAFRNAAKNGEAALRYEGSHYYVDHTLSAEQIAALKETFEAYDAINGL